MTSWLVVWSGILFEEFISGNGPACAFQTQQNGYTQRMKAQGQNHDHIFEQYWRHAEALRRWFVAYGIGGIVLFVSNQDKLIWIDTQTLRIICALFLTGVLLQVILTFINKIHNYNEWNDACVSNSDPLVTTAPKLNIKTDIAFDVLTFSSYLAASIILVFAPQAAPSVDKHPEVISDSNV